MKILHYKRLQSTNTIAFRLGEEGASEWTVVTADTQTKGRGRGGRKWESAKGGLWFSILLRPHVSSERILMLQFLAANAARYAIEDQTGQQVRLKWPNDLMLNGAKLGGILVESKTKDDKVEFAVIGIGININQRKSQLPQGASSLFVASGLHHDAKQILQAILDQMRLSIDELEAPSRILENWWRWCAHRPPQVEVTLPTRVVTGISRGIDDGGALLVETSDHRIERVSEGTLRLLDDLPA